MPEVKRSFYVHSPDQIPKGEHWAILTGGSVFIEGDERSRTNPGHGYPARTEQFITYQAFLDREEFFSVLEAQLRRLPAYGGAEPKGIHVTETFTKSTQVTVAVESQALSKPDPGCAHRRLNEDGICRACGKDCRGG